MNSYELAIGAINMKSGPEDLSYSGKNNLSPEEKTEPDWLRKSNQLHSYSIVKCRSVGETMKVSANNDTWVGSNEEEGSKLLQIIYYNKYNIKRINNIRLEPGPPPNFLEVEIKGLDRKLWGLLDSDNTFLKRSIIEQINKNNFKLGTENEKIIFFAMEKVVLFNHVKFLLN
jgi:hypothetical protein